MNATISFNLHYELFVIRFLLYTVVLNLVPNVFDRSVDRVDSNKTDRLINSCVFLSWNITATVIDV